MSRYVRPLLWWFGAPAAFGVAIVLGVWWAAP